MILTTKSHSDPVTPELKILVFVVAAMGFAYIAVFPRMADKSILRMLKVDLAITAALLVIAGLAFGGQGVGFTLLFFDVPWWLYTITVGVLVETPLFLWFCQKYDIDITDFEDRG